MADLVQIYNPKIEKYVLVNRDIGIIVEHKITPGPWLNIPVVDTIDRKKVGSEKYAT